MVEGRFIVCCDDGPHPAPRQSGGASVSKANDITIKNILVG
jgi:hypothetical protein